jgi:hypothetical protein
MVLHYNCPVCIFQWHMGYCKCFDSVPWPLHITHDPPWSCNIPFPWGPYSAPGDMTNSVLLSHGHSLLTHGAVYMHVIHVPWASYNSTLDITEIPDIPHGTLWSCIASAPWTYLQRSMGHYKCYSSIPWGTVHYIWSLPDPVGDLSHGGLTMVHGTLQCHLSYGPLSLLHVLDWKCIALSHGHIAILHGRLKRFCLYPMGNCASPMVIHFPALYLPHGFLTAVHGTLQMSPMGNHCLPMVFLWLCTTSVPWATCTSPMVIHSVAFYMSHGFLTVLYGTLQMSPMGNHCFPMSLLECVLYLSHWYMPMAQRTLKNIVTLSHGPLYITHGPVWPSTISVPWVCCCIPRDTEYCPWS